MSPPALASEHAVTVDWAPDRVEAVAALLTLANGRRRGRVLTMEDVRACADEALRGPDGYAWRHGGEVDDARALTTVCLAVRSGDTVTVGLSAAHAQGVTPSRAFADLSQWERFHVAANVLPCRAWAARPRGDRVLLSLARAPQPPAGVDASLLRAVLEAPDQDGPRSVLADWWAERGDPRGELVAVQLELERLQSDEPRAEALVARQATLLAAHGAAWLGPGRDAVQARFRRGFIEAITLIDADGLPALDGLFAREPITELVIRTTRRIDGVRLALAPWLWRVRTLAFESEHRNAGRLGVGGLQQALLQPVRTSPRSMGLRELRFVHQGLGDEGLALLAARGSAGLGGVGALVVERDTVTAAGVRALFAGRWGGLLQTLSLSHNALGVEGARVFEAVRSPARLTSLALDGNGLGDAGARALANAPALASLRRLSLCGNGIGRPGLDALLASPHLRRLESLWVSGNRLGEAGRRLVASRFPADRPS